MWSAVSNGKNGPDQVGGLIHVEVRTPSSSTSAKEVIHIEARTPLSASQEHACLNDRQLEPFLQACRGSFEA